MTPREELQGSFEALDDQTVIIYLEVPQTTVVLFQAYFELYEGLGLVRTLELRRSLLSVITTPQSLESCCEALSEIKTTTQWRPAGLPSEEEKSRYLGYFAGQNIPRRV